MKNVSIRRALPLLMVLLGLAQLAALEVKLPNKEDSLRMAVIGDSGTGGREQYEVGARLAEARAQFPFDTVLMTGDNLYGRERPQDYERKFERPYKPLLAAGVKFYASLGNHDDREQRNYRLFNMNGELYYTFKGSKQNVRFFALESSYMDREQLDWLERELGRSTEDWKIVFMHHPIYSSGERHGSSMALREVLEPLFLEHGVSVVFAGHEHFYERLKPQKGITYITQGAAAKLRRGNLDDDSAMTARGFDRDRSFTLVEINGAELRLQTISRTGETVDTATILRRGADPRTPTPQAQGRTRPTLRPLPLPRPSPSRSPSPLP